MTDVWVWDTIVPYIHKKIPELCHKSVQQFINGFDFVLAFTKRNVYTVGYNDGTVGQSCDRKIRLFKTRDNIIFL